MTKNFSQRKVDFDEYAEKYEALLRNQLNFFSSDRDYFSKYKAEVLKNHVSLGSGNILDFGAGIGLMIPSLQEAFPEGRIFASDISAGSLRHLTSKFPDVSVLPDDRLPDHRFDLILIATVLHHIEPKLRDGIVGRLVGLLNPGGRICIFEHNPFNPITQRMVSTCPFDEDAILLGMTESKKLLADAGLEIERRGYTLFVPPSLSVIRPLEKALEWLPLGGQYYVIGRKRAES